MRRTAGALLMLALVSTGCDVATAGTPEAMPTTTGPKPATTQTTQTGSAAPDVAACYSGTCEITVSGPISFPVSPTFGVDTVSVAAIGTDTVAVDATGPGITLGVGVQVGSSGGLNNLTVTVLSVRAGTAVLRFTH